MVKHLNKTTNWHSARGKRDETHLILGYVARDPNPYTGAMDSVRIVLVTDNTKKKEGPTAIDIRNWVESKSYTGPSKTGGVRLERYHLTEILSMLPEIKKALEITEEEIQEEIDERKAALAELKEE